MSNIPKTISLFSGAGIGDVGLRAAGLHLLRACEIEPDRAALAHLNFPESDVLALDVASEVEAICSGPDADPFLLCCTAPCQGMSKNGQGTLLRNVRNGLRPRLDPRNQLVLPALEIAVRLRPKWIVFENVVEMRRTLILDARDNLRLILDVIFDALREEYVGAAYDVEMADYGIPQRRRRLITVLTRDPIAGRRFERGARLIPPPTHAKQPMPGRKPWVSVSEALRDFPELDGVDRASATCPEIPFHFVPVLDPKKYEWIRHVPPGKSAFDNQCVNVECRSRDNPVHGASRDGDGINRANGTTPLHCVKCGSLLPRPFTVTETGEKRIMTGYTSAYKRMDAKLPAPALTRNLSYACSDQKLHPVQNRVLSLAEAMTLHTLTRYAYRWGPLNVLGGKRPRKMEQARSTLIRLVLGESVPPLFFELLGRHLLQMSKNNGHGRSRA